MRRGVIQRILSRLLWFSAASSLLPLLVGLYYRDGTWLAWLAAAAAAAVAAYGLGNLPKARQAPRDSLRRREGFLAVVLGWLVMIFFTALAYHVTGAFPGFAEAFFESASGFTTTGASVVGDIEALPKSILLQRSLSHWIGGMGIIVLSVAILPELAVGGMQLFSAESSGIGAVKLAPRIAATARRLWVVYVALTGGVAVLLLFGGMSSFDAVNHAMSTIATGGFSTRNESIGAYDSVYIDVVVTIFMFASGVSFALLYRAVIQGRPGAIVSSTEVRLYTGVTVAAILFIAISLHASAVYDSVGDCLRYASFNTVAIATTTGFATADFDVWPHFTRALLVVLMLVGGCAGSTSGGSKVVRLLVVIKHAGYQLRRLVRPRLVQSLEIDGREVSRETTEAVLGFYLLYFAALMLGSLAMTALGMDLVSGTTAAVSALNSIGPGLGAIGPAENFSAVHAGGMYLLSFGMLLGRLEIYTVLVLFTPHFWRRG